MNGLRSVTRRIAIIAMRDDTMHILALPIIVTLFAAIYFGGNHAYGAWGDDAHGYALVASRIAHGEAVTHQNEMVSLWVENLGRANAWIAKPTHFDILNESGDIGSRYPLAFPALLAAGSGVSADDAGMYLVVPILGLASHVAIYFIVKSIVPGRRGTILGLLAAAMLGSSIVFSARVLAQPLRETPSTAYLLLSFLALIAATRRRLPREVIFLVAIAGLAFGVAFAIKEINAVAMAPSVAILLVMTIRNIPGSIRLTAIALFAVGIVIALTPYLVDTISRTALNEFPLDEDAFLSRTYRDSRGLDVSNLENGLQASRSQVPDLVDSPVFLPLVLAGLAGGALLRRIPWIILSLFLWAALTVLVYAFWVNHYPRYLVPAIPPLVLLAIFGIDSMSTLVERFLRLRWSNRAVPFIAACAGLAVAGAIIAPGMHDTFALAYTEPVVGRGMTLHDLRLVQELRLLPDDSIVLFGSGTKGKRSLQRQNAIHQLTLAHARQPGIKLPREPTSGEFADLARFLEMTAPTSTLFLWDEEGSSTGSTLLRSLGYDCEHSQKFAFDSGPAVNLCRLKQL